MRKTENADIEEVQELFARIMRGIKGFPARKQLHGDVTFGQMRVLRLLESKESCAMGEVAQMLLVTRPTATSVVNRLVSRGFIGRERDKKDRRIVKLRLRPKGASLLASRRRLLKRRIRQMLYPMTRDEREKFVIALRAISSQVERHSVPEQKKGRSQG